MSEQQEHLEGGKIQSDEEIDQDPAVFRKAKVSTDELDLDLPPTGKVSLTHMVLHLPCTSKSCLSCYLAKKVKSHSRRRPLSGVTVLLKEGEEL